MARSSGRPSQFERAYRILEYLRWNSDRDHPVTQAEMKRCGELGSYLGGKDTSHNLILSMVSAMNFGEHGLRPHQEWKLNFKEFEAQYGGELQEDDDSEAPALDKLSIRGLYYQHSFTYDEVNRIIEAVQLSGTLNTRETKALIEKLERSLTTRFYPRGPKQVCTVLTPKLTPPEKLRENLLTIQRAIEGRRKISFFFNAYRRDKQLHRVRETRDVLSPYYVAASGGRYYLLACKEGKAAMSIWRIDLMTELQITERRAENRGRVKGLPSRWTEEFHLSHLNMAFDEPVSILLRIVQGDGGSPVNYTFLHDWFGDTFRVVKTEEGPSPGDLVRVDCSPFAMVNWALQYSDRVEVLEPAWVREEIVQKIRALERKYGAGGKEVF